MMPLISKTKCFSKIEEKSSRAKTQEMNLYPAGCLEIAFGPMFSGKTSWLNARLTALADIDKTNSLRILRIGHSIDKVDNRGTNGFTGCNSHSSSFFGLSPKIECIITDDLFKIELDKWNVIGIDEAHFHKDLVRFVEMCMNENKVVFVVGLNGDFNAHKFGEISELIPLADKVLPFTAQCSDCILEGRVTEAPFTVRTVKFEGQIHVGGADDFKPVCRMHRQRHQMTCSSPELHTEVDKVEEHNYRKPTQFEQTCWLTHWRHSNDPGPLRPLLIPRDFPELPPTTTQEEVNIWLLVLVDKLHPEASKCSQS